MIIINNEEEFNEKVLNSSEKVLVDFNAKWCGPCRMLHPILEELSSSYKIASVDTDEVTVLASKYGVMSIPCMVLINNGKEEKRIIGLHSKDEIIEFLK